MTKKDGKGWIRMTEDKEKVLHRKRTEEDDR